jgi:hypothetical protein
VSHLDDELAFNGVEPLVLIVMQVPRGAALSVEPALENEQTVIVLRAHLELNGANAEASMLAQSVFARRNPKDRG